MRDNFRSVFVNLMQAVTLAVLFGSTFLFVVGFLLNVPSFKFSM